jgi:precorrin-2/cobalt-factor-2 C20-methyltransferase
MTAMPGTLHVIGVGPGDPELMTLKAARAIAASKVIAYFAKRGEHGHARRTADA